MKTFFYLTVAGLILGLTSCTKEKSPLVFPEEKRFSDLKQLTDGGTNAEAYWSFDGKQLVFQHSAGHGGDPQCDQIYTMDRDGGNLRQVSTGEGRTTCGYFYPDNKKILYASTHQGGKSCPPEPDRSKGYVWPIYPTYQNYWVDTDSQKVEPKPLETNAPLAYTAEATVCKDGSVVFTSDRNGDLDLYTGKLQDDGSIKDVKQVTNTIGYDGGAFFSPDCKKLVWRASRPKNAKEKKDYLDLLKKHLIRPGELEIWVADRDGSNAYQVTRLGAASFAPFFSPDGNKILFSSNKNKPGGRNFDIFMIHTDGTRLEQVTFSKTFDAFPMFSPDGKYLAFSSNRNNRKPRETNVFVAEWNELAERDLQVSDQRPEDRFKAVVEVLASDDFEGRGTNTEGLTKAENFVEEQFKSIGLEPYFGNSYRQAVEIQTGVSVSEENTRLKVAGKDLRLNTEFLPAAFSTSSAFEGEVVDLGYGVVSLEHEIDSYRGKDVKGKVALIRRGLPKNQLRPEVQASYSDLRYKAFLAREKGAKAILFWDGEFPSLEGTGPVSDAGIPVLFVKKRTAAAILTKAKKVEGNVALKRELKTHYNVVGQLGRNCTSGNTVLVGAHLDHLGMGGESSLEVNQRGIHNGADDNASGIAAVLEIARTRKTEFKKDGGGSCFQFAAFTGEEVGLVGSSALSRYMKEKGGLPKAMLNLDMVGRLRNNRLIVFGGGTAKEWESLIQKTCGEAQLECPTSGDGYGPSDQMAFYIAGVPVLHFFTGSHSEYHSVNDDARLINATGGVQVAEVVSKVAATVAHPAFKLQLQAPKEKPMLVAGMKPRGDRAGLRPYLGTIPDYSKLHDPGSRGVLLSGVRPGSPAEKAGLKAGDLLVGFDEKSIQNLRDMAHALALFKPGDGIALRVIRGGQELKLQATLGKKSYSNR